MKLVHHIRHLKDRIVGKVPHGKKRSEHWPAFRAKYLAKQCAVCSGTVKLELHHKKPFHLHPELELDPNNVITLCESKKHGVNCHLWFGHLGNFKAINKDVLVDAVHWSIKQMDSHKAAGL